MIDAQGVYIGEICTGSNYGDNEFCDFVFTIDELEYINAEVYTNDDNYLCIENAKRTNRSKALSYYSKYLTGMSGTDERVCDIVCSSSGVELMVFREDEVGELKEILVKSTEIIKEDGEELQILKIIGTNFDKKYPNVTAIKELNQMIEDYEFAVLYDECQLPDKLAEIMKIVHTNIINKKEKFVIVYEGYELELSYEVYLRQVIDEIVDYYINAINKLISHNNNSLLENEKIVVYMGRYGEGSNIVDKLRQIEKKHHVKFEVINDIEKSIARGNAYYYFLTKALLKDTIEKNLSRYQFCYYDEKVRLSYTKDLFVVKVVNDFESSICIKIDDTILDKVHEYMFYCPFIKCGDDLEIMYEYTTRGMVLTMTYNAFEERQEFKIKY